MTLAECCFESGGIGRRRVDSAAASDGGVDRLAATLFGESASRVDRQRRARSARRGARRRHARPACRPRTSAGPAARRSASRSTVKSAIDVRASPRPRRDGARALANWLEIDGVAGSPEAETVTDDMDKFKEECGIFGIYGHSEAANLTYLGLYALQHRGQESVGIATSDGVRLQIHKAMGYVADSFDEADHRAAGRHERRRPRALLDGRRERPEERAADPHRLRARRDRDLPQRQSRQRAGAARRARPAGLDLPDDERHRGAAASLRAVEAPHAGAGADRGDLAGAGRVLARAADEGPADCGSRSARLPAADDRPPRRRLHRLLRDVRARPDRRRVDARHRAGRGVHRRAGGREVGSRRFRRRRRRTASSSTCTSRGRTRTCSARA